MAHISYRTNKKGEMFAKIQVSGKDPRTGEHKLYLKTIKNESGLTEAKFKKLANKEAIAFEENIINQIKDEVITVRTKVLTFPQLAEEWLNTINANLSRNYFERSSEYVSKFNKYLESVGLYNVPVSEIRVRDVQIFLNSFSKGYIKGAKLSKLIKPLPKGVSFRALDREKIINRCSSYKMNNMDCLVKTDTAQAICAFYNLKWEDYFEDASQKAMYSVETIKGYRRVLRTVFNEAVRYEWITKNPVCSTKIGTGKGNFSIRAVEEKEVFSIEETRKLLDALDKLPEDKIFWKIVTKLMLLCGLRVCEVCGLRWDDIDLNNRTIHIRRNRMVSKVKGVYEKDTKTKTSKRTMPIPDGLIDDLREYWDWFEEADRNFARKQNKYYVASNIYREPIYPHSIRSWLVRFEQSNGFKRVTCHGLRHTFCSILLANSVPIQTVSKYMGHSDSTVTLQVYSHFMPDTQHMVVDALNVITQKRAGR